MPELSDYLKDKYASVQNQEFVCDVCNSAFSNKRALASHKKLHKTKKEQNIVVHTE
jgi:transposase-like protein